MSQVRLASFQYLRQGLLSLAIHELANVERSTLINRQALVWDMNFTLCSHLARRLLDLAYARFT